MKWFLLGCGLVLSSSVLALELEMPSVFADHMVLQCDQRVPVWGVADAGATVAVEFAGQEVLRLFSPRIQHNHCRLVRFFPLRLHHLRGWRGHELPEGLLGDRPLRV